MEPAEITTLGDFAHFVRERYRREAQIDTERRQKFLPGWLSGFVAIIQRPIHSRTDEMVSWTAPWPEGLNVNDIKWMNGMLESSRIELKIKGGYPDRSVEICVHPNARPQ